MINFGGIQMVLNNFSIGVKVDINYELRTIEQGMRLFKTANRLIDSIEVFLNDESKYDMDNGLILLDKLDEVICVDIATLESFSLNAVSGYQDLRRRLFDCFEAYYPLKAIITSNLESFIPLDINELNEVHFLMKTMAGHLGIFITRQFEFESFKEGNAPEMSLEMYLANNKMDKQAFLDLYKGMQERITLYRPKIEIFDEHPELEESFMEKVGPWFYDINYMDYQDVLDVINDKLDPEDLKAKLNGGTDGDL